MAGYIGSKSSVTQVDGYTEAEADAEFVNDPSSVITVSGSNVGIGTSSPSANLEISSTVQPTIRVTDSDNSNTAFMQADGVNGAYFGTLTNHPVRLAPNNSTKMVVTTDGNVGIGTTSPQGKLHVYSDNVGTPSADADDFIIEKTGDTGLSILSTSTGRIYFGDTASNDQGSIRYVHGDNSMRFETDSAERMRIGSNGYVGIGTSSPSTKLTVLANSANGIDLAQDPDDVSNSGRLFFTTSGGSNSIRSTSGALQFSTGATAGTSSGTERMRIDSSGNVRLANTSMNIDNSGNTATGLSVASTGITHIATSGNNTSLLIQRVSDTGTDNAIYFLYGTTGVGSVTVNSSSTAYNTSSDYRLKENVVDLTGASARVNQLDVKRFNFIADDTNTLVDGFLAHEVATVVPEAITGTKDAMKDEEYEVTPATGDIYTPSTDAYVDDDGNDVDAVDEVIHSADAEQPETLEDGQQWRETTAPVMGTRSVPDYQGIDQSKLVPLLTAALQEALTEIASLKTRVEALEA